MLHHAAVHAAPAACILLSPLQCTRHVRPDPHQGGGVLCHAAPARESVTLCRALLCCAVQTLMLWEMLWADDQLQAALPEQAVLPAAEPASAPTQAAHGPASSSCPEEGRAGGTASLQPLQPQESPPDDFVLIHGPAPPSPVMAKWEEGEAVARHGKGEAVARHEEGEAVLGKAGPSGSCPAAAPAPPHAFATVEPPPPSPPPPAAMQSSSCVAVAAVAASAADPVDPSHPGGGGRWLPAASGGPGLFLYFVSAVVVSQRRWVLDTQCHDNDGVLVHFQTLRNMDVHDCMRHAREYRTRLLREGRGGAKGPPPP